MDTSVVLSKVLIVDDVPTNRAIIGSLLPPTEYTVTEAGDGEQALSLIFKHGFDLVILDVLMPGMNGIEVLSKIREQFTESELPVLMLTVKDDIDSIVEGLEHGANDYITRPIDFSVLQARIKIQLTHKHTQDQLRQHHNMLEQLVDQRTQQLTNANQSLTRQIKDTKIAEEVAKVGEARYQALYHDNPSMFFTIDESANVVSVNQFGAALLGYSVDELTGTAAETLYTETEQKKVRTHILECFNNPDEVQRWESCKVKKDGSLLWVRSTVRQIQQDDGVKQLFMVCEDITEAHYMSEQLAYRATHDDLTGLINRREFEHRLGQLINTTKQTNATHALCYVDLDHFKAINDSCGHIAGDECLRQIAEIIQTHAGSYNLLARIGGDEFTLIFHNCDLELAKKRANKLLDAIHAHQFFWLNDHYSLSASIGLVVVDKTTDNIPGLLSMADTSCYAAKQQGRNRIHLFKQDDVLIKRRKTDMAWAARIESAIEQDNFLLLKQDIAPLQQAGTGRHYEVLIRMLDSNGEQIRPKIFIPVAERYGTAGQIDRWVIGHCLKWLSGDPGKLDDLSMVSINLSGQSISDPGLLKFITEQMAATNIPPQKICFEITETAAITNLTQANQLIINLKKVGCKFALDDFGRGLSSFAYLKNLPIDYVKIDGMFVKNMLNSRVDREVVNSINQLAKILGKQTIAEFVPDQETIELLTELGVDYAQGAAIGLPSPLLD